MSAPSNPAATSPLSPAVAAAAFENAPIPTAIVQITDAEPSIVDVNLAFAGLVDRPRETLAGCSLAELLTGTGDLLRVLSEPTGHRGVDGFVAVCGEERIPVTLRVGIVDASESMPELVLVQVNELIHRRQMERALRESEQRVQDLVDNVDALIYIKSADGRYLLINRHFEETFGIRRDDPVVKTNYDIVSPETAAVYTANDRRVIEAGIPIHFEEPKSAGDSGTWLSLKFPLFDEDGQPYAVAGISTDITERKTAEAAVRQAKDEAERANRAKSDFLSRMSHELRTPLNSILGFGQLLQLEPLPAGATDSVDRIVNAGRHLLALINEVLEISRIEAGRQPLQVEPVHCCGPLTEAVDLVRPLAAGRDIAIEQDLHAGLYEFVLADYQRLKQVLLNVLTNAVKYNRPGGTVRIVLQVLPDRRLRYRFADTGRGIAPEDLERAFLPFERLDADSTDAEGTGLGLALSKGLIDAMGGAIGVERSVKGEGSTFYVDLPLTDNPHDDAGYLFQPERTPFPRRIERGGRVLYIEDNLANYDLVQQGLRAARRPRADVGHAGTDGHRARRPAPARPDPARPPPARHRRRGGAAAAARGRAHARHPGDHPLGRRHARAGRAPQGTGRRGLPHQAARAGRIRRGRRARARPGHGLMDAVGRVAPPRLVRVVIADDHPVYRKGAAGLINGCPELEVVGEAGTGAEALEGIRSARARRGGRRPRPARLRRHRRVGMLEREGSATRVVIVSASEDGPTIYRAFAHGARAYIPKVSSGDLLCSTLLRVATGESVIPPSIQSALTRELRVRRDRTDEPLLTARELEILRMCADGLTSAAIAEELFVSVPTVKTHLQHVYAKLEVSDRAAAVAQALRRGLLT